MRSCVRRSDAGITITAVRSWIAPRMDHGLLRGPRAIAHLGTKIAARRGREADIAGEELYALFIQVANGCGRSARVRPGSAVDLPPDCSTK